MKNKIMQIDNGFSKVYFHCKLSLRGFEKIATKSGRRQVIYLAPAFLNNSFISSSLAKSKAVYPSLFLILTSAPFSTKSFTISKSPYLEALIKAV